MYGSTFSQMLPHKGSDLSPLTESNSRVSAAQSEDIYRGDWQQSTETLPRSDTAFGDRAEGLLNSTTGWYNHWGQVA